MMNALLMYGPLSILVVWAMHSLQRIKLRVAIEAERNRAFEQHLQQALQHLESARVGLRQPGIRAIVDTNTGEIRRVPTHVDFDAGLADLGLIEPFFDSDKLYWRKSAQAPTIPTNRVFR